jgi:hypothetical protein
MQLALVLLCCLAFAGQAKALKDDIDTPKGTERFISEFFATPQIDDDYADWNITYHEPTFHAEKDGAWICWFAYSIGKQGQPRHACFVAHADSSHNDGWIIEIHPAPDDPPN